MSERILSLSAYVTDALVRCPVLAGYVVPWDATSHAVEVVRQMLTTVGPEFAVVGEVAVHSRAVVEPGAVIRGPAILSEGCVVAAHAYVRDGVFLDQDVRIGPSCEVKASFIFRGAVLAHMNYVGNSLIGAGVNLEAGAVLANHFNERDRKAISMLIDGRIVAHGCGEVRRVGRRRFADRGERRDHSGDASSAPERRGTAGARRSGDGLQHALPPFRQMTTSALRSARRLRLARCALVLCGKRPPQQRTPCSLRRSRPHSLVSSQVLGWDDNVQR